MEDFPRTHYNGILNQIQQMTGELQCEPENFTGRIIFMSMFNDIVWYSKGNVQTCEYNSKTIGQYARRFPRGHWSFLGPGSEKKWYGTCDHKPDGSWDRTAERTLLTLAETEHPVFRGTSALERRFKKQRKWKDVNYTSVVAPKILNCFSKWSSPSISSVSTEQ